MNPVEIENWEYLKFAGDIEPTWGDPMEKGGIYHVTVPTPTGVAGGINGS